MSDLSPTEVGRLRRYLDSIEVPDCGCPASEALCEHVRSVDHALPLADWSALLEAAWPGEYREPSPAQAGQLVMTHAARVAVMEARARRGEALWHPDDLAHAGHATRLGIYEGPRLSNGADNHRAGRLVTRRPESA